MVNRDEHQADETKIIFRMKKTWHPLINWLAPVGWEDEAGFHYGPQRGSLNPRNTTAIRNALFLLVALCLPTLAQTNALFIGPPANTATLQWNYTASEVSSNLTFTIYTAPSLTIPHTNWQTVTNFSSLSNSVATASNLQFTVRVPVWYGAQFWTATADDVFWGKSFFAQDAWTNPLPRIDQHITITR